MPAKLAFLFPFGSADLPEANTMCDSGFAACACWGSGGALFRWAVGVLPPCALLVGSLDGELSCSLAAERAQRLLGTRGDQHLGVCWDASRGSQGLWCSLVLCKTGAGNSGMVTSVACGEPVSSLVQGR